MQGSGSTRERVVTAKVVCAGWIWHSGSYPVPPAPELSIFEVPRLDPSNLKWELTDQAEQNRADGGGRCLFTDVCPPVHSCPLSLAAAW